MAACPNCGEQNPERARFCLSCGRALTTEGSDERAHETRRRVTVLFTDVVGSTPIGERLDPEALREVMQRYFDAMRVAIERHEGTVEKFIGDAVMAVFGIPQIHEDDALRAVRAAMDMEAALSVLNRDLQQRWGVELVIRTGINTGEVVAGDASAHQTLATGDVVNTAARLEQVAGANEVLIGPATYRLVRHAVQAEETAAVPLKGKADPIAPWRVQSVQPAGSAEQRRFDSPMVGRDRQLRALLDAAVRSREDRAPQLVTILGLAGVGKSRLVHEFLERARSEATVIRGRCLSYGDAITYWPLSEALKSAAGITADDSAERALERLAALAGDIPRAGIVVQRVATAIGIGESAPMSDGQETFWAIRRLLEAMAARMPLVVVFDDIHWATPTFLELIEHIADWARDAPILLVTLARPELLEVRPSWGGGKLNATTLLLEPLDDASVELIMRNLVGGVDLAAELATKIEAAAEGNPLFVEELLSMLVDDGVLERSGDAYRVARALGEVRVPPTIELLLAARLDHLPPSEREALGRASVIGRQFGAAQVAELTPAGERTEVLGTLLALVRKELVRQDDQGSADPVALDEDLRFRFRHQLVRDAAYEGLPKHERARLHQAFAETLERVDGTAREQPHEVIGYHLEQAAILRAAIGGAEEDRADLARRAAEHLEQAATRAQVVGDTAAVVRLLERATQLRPVDDAQRLRDLPTLAEAMGTSGRLGDAVALLDRVVDSPAAPPDARAAALEQVMAMFVVGHSAAEVRPRVEEALRIRRELGEPGGIARALDASGFVEFFLGRLSEAQRRGEEALRYAREAGDVALEGRLLGSLGAAYMMRPGSRRERAMMTAAEVLSFAQVNGMLGLESDVLDAQALLVGMGGDRARAHELVERAEAIRLDLGRVMDAQTTTEALLDRWAGHPDRAAARLEAIKASLQSFGEKAFLSTIASNLASALLDMDRTEEAEAACQLADATGAADDVVTRVELIADRARILARRGGLAEAEAMARQAVAAAEATEYRMLHSIAHLALGDALRRQERLDEAIGQWRTVIAQEQAFDNTIFVERLRRELVEIEAEAQHRKGHPGPGERVAGQP